MENKNFLSRDYGSDGEPYLRTRNKIYKIGNFAEEFSELIPNMTEKERKSDISTEFEENIDDLD